VGVVFFVFPCFVVRVAAMVEKLLQIGTRAKNDVKKDFVLLNAQER